MSGRFDNSEFLSDFKGTAPLFPLDTVVLYPNVLTPLHIFEPRYRQMIEHALEADRYIAMALLDETAPAAEKPPIHPITCLGRISAEEKLDDGRYYVVLQGLARAQIVRELEQPDLLYRTAELELCETQESTGSHVEDDLIRHEAVLRYRRAFPHVNVNKVFYELLGADCPLGVFCDIVANSLRQPPEEAQRILAATNAQQRAKILLEQINRQIKSGRSPKLDREFPPPFSPN